MAYYIATGFGHENHVGARRENGYRLMIDTARAEPVRVEKHGRGVVVVVAVKEYKRLKAIEARQVGKVDGGTVC